MVHGMWATASLWDDYCVFFNNQGYDVKAITLLHHGGILGELKDIGIMDYVEQAKTEIEKLNSRPIIIGHSMGGLIAQKLAEMGLARKLVFLAPAAPKGISVLTLSVAMTFSANISNVVMGRQIALPVCNKQSVLIDRGDKCILQYVLSVVRNVRYPSSLERADQCIVVSATAKLN